MRNERHMEAAPVPSKTPETFDVPQADVVGTSPKPIGFGALLKILLQDFTESNSDNLAA